MLSSIYGRGDKNAEKFFLRQVKVKIELFLPTIVIVEFFSYPTITNKEAEVFDQLFPQFTLRRLDFSTAKLAAQLRRNLKLKLADSVVAATAIETNSTLVTRNIRDFNKIPNLKLLAV